MNTIYFASQNLNKQKEILYYQKKFQVCDIRFQSLSDLSQNIQSKFQPKEEYYSFYENAKVKAMFLYNLIEAPVIAEDSGLLVEYLNHKPGVRSARIANTDKERNQIILEKLKNVKEDQRNAYFLSCICYVDQYANCIFFYGRAFGKIHSHLVGNNGFGYDSIFYFPALQKTFGEISTEEKMQYSHRGRALELLFSYLNKESIK